jgi:hypothetical protein
MPANLRAHSNLPVATSEQPVLYLALELGWDSWKLAFASGLGSAPRLRQIPARDVQRLVLEIVEAKRRLRLPADCPVVGCLRSGPRWLLARPLLAAARRDESRGRFVEH